MFHSSAIMVHHLELKNNNLETLMVKCLIHIIKALTIKYLDEKWQQQIWQVEDSISELLQHEYDHLNGILCTMRAIDNQSFKWRQTPE
jgi:peptide deformylase